MGKRANEMEKDTNTIAMWNEKKKKINNNQSHA